MRSRSFGERVSPGCLLVTILLAMSLLRAAGGEPSVCTSEQEAITILEAQEQVHYGACLMASGHGLLGLRKIVDALESISEHWDDPRIAPIEGELLSGLYSLRELGTVYIQDQALQDVAITADGDRVITAGLPAPFATSVAITRLVGAGETVRHRFKGRPLSPISVHKERVLLATEIWERARDRAQVVLWNVLMGERLGQKEVVPRATSATVTANGRIVLISDRTSGRAWLWNVEADELKSLQGAEGDITATAISPDGQHVVIARLLGLQDPATLERDSAEGDSSVEFRNVATGQRHIRRADEDRVTSIAIDPLTRVAVTGDYAGVLRLWDVETGDMLQLFTGHRSAIKDILLTDYASLALVLHDDGAVRTWTLRRRPVSYEEERNPFIPASALVGGREAVTRVALSRDGRLAVTASDDYAVRLWQPDTGALESVLRGHEGSVTDIALTPDSATAVSAGSDGTVRAWVAQPRASLFNLREFTPKRIGNGFIRFAPSWPFLLAVWDDSVIYWNTTSLQGAIVMDLNAIEEVAVSPDGKLAALGYENGSITVWEVAHGELKWESPGYPENSGSGVEGHGSAISSVTFSNDGGRLLTAEHGGSARVWDVGSGVSLVTLPHTCRHAPRFVDDGRTIATVRDTQLVLWDAMSFDIQSAVEIGTKIFGYGISKDGRHAAVSFYNDGAQMQLWDLIGKRKVSELQPHASVIWSLEFSPTGGRFLSRSDDATAKLWSSDGELIRVYGRPRGGRWVYDSVFSPSGRIFALGFDNGVVELYSAADGTHIVTLDAKDLVILDPTDVQRMRRMTARNSPPRIVDLEFSLDGKWLAALTRDGYVRLWPAFPRVGDAVAHAKRALRTYSRGLD